MLILGVTGGIATGKSTVTEIFADLGAAVVSADKIAHDLLHPGSPLSAQVANEFPECRALSGTPPDPRDQEQLGRYARSTPDTVDRQVLARLIFSDPRARRRLERITHPPITEQLRRLIDEFRPLTSPPIAAIEVPLLYEAKLTKFFDRVVVVACGHELQIRRIEDRFGITREEALLRIDSQWPLARKQALANDVVFTDGDIGGTREQVLSIWQDALYSHLRL